MNESPKNPSDLEVLLRRAEPGCETAFEVVREMTADADGAARTRLTVERRQLQPEPAPEPRRATSPRRSHVFYDPAAFVAYLNRYGGADTLVMADPISRRVAAVLDECAGRGFETLALAPPLHPLYAPWADQFGRRVAIGAFAEFLLENRSVVNDPEPRALALTFRQITVAETTTIHRGAGARSINGVVCARTVKGQCDEQLLELPDRLTITLPLLACSLDNRSLIVDLTVGVEDGHVYVVPTCAAAAVEMLEEFDGLVKGLKLQHAGAVVGLGYVEHEPWDVLDGE